MLHIPSDFNHYIQKCYDEHTKDALDQLAKQYGWCVGVLNLDMEGQDKNIDYDEKRINALLDENSTITGFKRG